MHKIRYKLSKIVPVIKSYHKCCICLEESSKVTKCSNCVDGIICHKCRGKLTSEQQILCPVCRQEYLPPQD